MRGAALALMLVGSVGLAQADGQGGEIAWRTGLADAFAEAKAAKRPIFVAVNNITAEGEGVEVASKLLREKVYTDPKFIELTEGFVCVLLRSPISSEDGGELRDRYEIDGMIVTPQHLLLHADGALIERKEYWEYGDAESSIQALSLMLAKARKAHEVRQRLPRLEAGTRAAWIQGAAELVRAGADTELRVAAVREMTAADQDGDCLAALHGVVAAAKDPAREDVVVLVEVVRALGRPKLDLALPGLTALLEAKDASLRSHAAVSLEYVGAPGAAVPLLKRAGKERDEVVRSNLLRAAGRCGAGDPEVRKALLREAAGKSDVVAAGATIGLAYFEKDPEVARGLERTMKGGGDGLRRTATLWTLAQVGDQKTAGLLRAQLAETAEVLPSYRLLEACLACLDGQDESRLPELDQTLRWALREKTKGEDPARARRAGSNFLPKGDFR